MIKIKEIKIKGIEIADSSDRQDLKEIAEARAVGEFAKLFSEFMKSSEETKEEKPKAETDEKKPQA